MKLVAVRICFPKSLSQVGTRLNSLCDPLQHAPRLQNKGWQYHSTQVRTGSQLGNNMGEHCSVVSFSLSSSVETQPYRCLVQAQPRSSPLPVLHTSLRLLTSDCLPHEQVSIYSVRVCFPKPLYPSHRRHNATKKAHILAADARRERPWPVKPASAPTMTTDCKVKLGGYSSRVALSQGFSRLSRERVRS